MKIYNIFQASRLPMSIIIVGVGEADFKGEATAMTFYKKSYEKMALRKMTEPFDDLVDNIRHL